MSMERVRIYDLAKELRTPSKDLLDLIKQKLNISLKSHSSSISGEDAEMLRNHIKEARAKKSSSTAPKAVNTTTQIAQRLNSEESTKEAPPKMENKTTITLEPKTSETEETQKPIEEEKKVVEQKTAPSQPVAQSQQAQGSSFSQQSRYKQPLNLSKPQQRPEAPKAQAPTNDKPYRISGNKYKYKPGANSESRTESRTETRGSKPVGRYGIKRPSPYFKESEMAQKEASADTQIENDNLITEPINQISEVKPIAAISEEITDNKPVEEIKEVAPQPIEQTTPVQAKVMEEPHTAVAPPQKDKYQHPRQEHQSGPRHRHSDFNQRPHKQHFKPQNSENRVFDKPQPDKAKVEATAATATSQKEPNKDGAQAIRPGKIVHKKDFGKKKDYSQKDKHQELKPLAEIFKKKKPEKKEAEIVKPTEVSINQPLTISELSELLVISPAEIIKELFKAGILATLNQNISAETAKDVSEKLGYTIKTEKMGQAVELTTEKEVSQPIPEKAIKYGALRAPIVTIMGHVDHGKTTLLDTIRKTKNRIVDTEVGGITQSIGAYSAEIHGKKIVFIDTPGHEAFTAMRARGARVTDIVIIIVAADDGIMPQTVEAISHAKAAGVPIIVAVNKIDKAGADPDRVLQQLTEHDLLPEAWGGDTVTVSISAAKGDNIDELLEMILLVAELQELKADPKALSTGVVIESILDKGKGPVACVLVQNGTLKVGDFVLVGKVGGKVRALISDKGERLTEAGPSTPVEILGLSEVPSAGDQFEVVSDDKTLKQLLSQRKEQDKERRLSGMKQITLQQDTIFKSKTRNKKDEIKDLNIIIKADTDGSAKAVENALQELKSKEISVKIIHIGIGDISEADVMLAVTSNAMIIGFRVKEDANAAKVSQTEGINVRTYEIIYQISEDIEKTMLGLLSPEVKEIELGKAEVRNLFTVGKNVVIAGCYVLEGKVVRNRTATVLRGNKEIFKGTLDNLKRFKDDAKEVASGYECGISFNKFNDLQEGDIIKVTTIEEIERASLN